MNHFKSKKNQVLFVTLFIIVILFFLNGLYSSFYLRQLTNDGARWAINIFNKKSLNIDFPLIRFSTLIIQIPSVIFVKAGGGFKSFILLFCLSYFIYPFIGLIIANQSSDQKFMLVSFLILIFCIVPGWGFAVSVVNEAIIIALIYFSLLLYPQKYNYFFKSILAISLAFSYELSIIFLLFFAFVEYYEKRKITFQLAVLIFSMTIVLSNLFFRLLPINVEQTFIDTLKYAWFSWQLLNVIYILISLGVFVLLKPNKITSSILVILAIFLTYFQLFNFQYNWLGHEDFFNRTWAIPVTCVFFIIYYFSSKIRDNSFPVYLTVIIAILGVCNLKFDIESTSSIKNFTTNLKFKLLSTQGCHYLTQEEVLDLRKNNSIGSLSFLPLHSILNHRDENIHALLFFDENGSPENPCKISQDDLLISTKDLTFKVPTNLNINFRSLIEFIK